MSIDWKTPKRRWRPRFSLLTLVLGVVFVGACGGMWWRWAPWMCDLVLRGHGDVVNYAAFSPDDRMVFTASNDCTARVWDAETGAELSSLRHISWVWSGAFSPDGQEVVTACADGSVVTWDAKTGKRRLFIRGHPGGAYSASFSPSGKRIVSAGEDGAVRIWDAETGRGPLLLLKHAGPVRCAAFSPDDCWIVTASQDGTARIWDAKTGKEQASTKVSAWGGFISAQFSPDGQRVLTVDTDVLRIWDVSTGKWCFLTTGDGCTSASFSPDGRQIAAGGGTGTVQVLDSETGQALAATNGHRGTVTSAVFSHDGHRIVTDYIDGTARIWSRRRPESTGGFVCLPEFWIALLSGSALLVVATRNLRRRKTPTPAAT